MGLAPGSPSKKRSPAAALAVASGILLSRVAGLVRERVFAHYLGNSDAAGAFRAALRIPNLLQNLFGEGVLSASFIPVYARLHAEGKEEEARKVAGVVFSLMAMVISVCVLGGVLASRPLIEVLAPGFSGDVRELTIQLVQIMFPGVGLLVLSAWCLGVLNSHRQFFLSYVAPVLWNIAMITLLLVAGARYSSTRAGQMELVRLVAWATVAGSFLQFAVQFPGALYLNGGLRFGLDWRLPSVKLILTNFFPALLSRGVVQLSAYLDQILASFLGPQSVSALAYAQTIYLLPVSLFGMAISSAELPEMARTLGAPEERVVALKSRLTKGLRRVAFYIVPSAVAFIALGNVIAGTLLQTGKFNAGDSRFVWWILIGSALGILANTQGRLCVSLFWALHDSKTPAKFAFWRVLVSAIFGTVVVFPLRQHYGLSNEICAAGLTAAAGTTAWMEFFLVRRSLARRIGEFGWEVRATFLFLAAAGLAASFALGLDYLLPPLYPALNGLLVLGTYGAFYLLITFLMRSEEAREALGPILRRLGKA